MDDVNLGVARASAGRLLLSLRFDANRGSESRRHEVYRATPTPLVYRPAARTHVLRAYLHAGADLPGGLGEDFRVRLACGLPGATPFESPRRKSARLAARPAATTYQDDRML